MSSTVGGLVRARRLFKQRIAGRVCNSASDKKIVKIGPGGLYIGELGVVHKRPQGQGLMLLDNMKTQHAGEFLDGR